MKHLSEMSPSEIGDWINQAASQEDRRDRKLVAFPFLYGSKLSNLQEILDMPKPKITAIPPILPVNPASRIEAGHSRLDSAIEAYRNARQHWEEANEALKSSDPCSSSHPAKVQAAIAATRNFLQATEIVQDTCRKA